MLGLTTLLERSAIYCNRLIVEFGSSVCAFLWFSICRGVINQFHVDSPDLHGDVAEIIISNWITGGKETCRFLLSWHYLF